jgi:Flp pilus assembly CpaF family ATPase
MTPPSATESRLGELRQLVQTGRLDWKLPIGDALQRAGLPGGLPAEEWARLAWYGPLETWLRADVNAQISDILINGPGRDVMVIDAGQRMPTGVRLHQQWIEFAQRQLLLRAGLISLQSPNLWQRHAMLGTADRRMRFAVTRPPASPDGPTIAIRLLPRSWRKIDDLVREPDPVLPRAAADLLIEALQRGVSVLVAGATGSGKTTLTGALLQAIGDMKRVVIVEESRELPQPADSLTMEVLNSGLSFTDCVRFALRQKPDLIVVGEVRGAEALSMLQAAASGHPGIGTIHAPDPQAALKNLERMASEDGTVPVNVVRGLMTSSAVPLIVAHIGTYGGRRCVGLIEEVLAQGATGQGGDRYPTNTLYAFEPRTGKVEKRYAVQGAWGLGRF